MGEVPGIVRGDVLFVLSLMETLFALWGAMVNGGDATVRWSLGSFEATGDFLLICSYVLAIYVLVTTRDIQKILLYYAFIALVSRETMPLYQLENSIKAPWASNNACKDSSRSQRNEYTFRIL